MFGFSMDMLRTMGLGNDKGSIYPDDERYVRAKKYAALLVEDSNDFILMGEPNTLLSSFKGRCDHFYPYDLEVLAGCLGLNKVIAEGEGRYGRRLWSQHCPSADKNNQSSWHCQAVEQHPSIRHASIAVQ